MRVIAECGRKDLAVVYIARTDTGKLIEFAESMEPPYPRRKKWVLMVSTLSGCPVSCPFCDAGVKFSGRLSKEEMHSQIDYMVQRRYPSGRVPAEKFKIQFARMGEPSYNDEVLDVLDELQASYEAPGLLPCLSTVAPMGRERFFERLLKLKKTLYPTSFQLQFSIHTTDDRLRDEIIPCKKWDFGEIADYGRRFFDFPGRKITLNFASAEGFPVVAERLLQFFDPSVFLIKMTPLNPTYKALENGYRAAQSTGATERLVRDLESCGYEVIQSVGEAEENLIGSNCGQYIQAHLRSSQAVAGAYTYEVRPDSSELDTHKVLTDSRRRS